MSTFYSYSYLLLFLHFTHSLSFFYGTEVGTEFDTIYICKLTCTNNWTNSDVFRIVMQIQVSELRYLDYINEK